jgi:hypothetical protein
VPSAGPYEVLGVRRDATVEEIRRAYVRLARRYHPDYHTDASPPERAEAEWRMRMLNDAWAVLGDTSRRRAFDDAQPRAFEPFSPAADDDEDPRDAPDVPYRPVPEATAGRRLSTVAPVGLFTAAAFIGVVGSVMRLTGVVVLAFILFLLSCVGFLVVPLLALSRARRDEG